MFEESPNCKAFDKLDVKELVETNKTSANRTRWLTLVLIVATVIIAVGFYNSMKSSWANYRIEALKEYENITENNIGKINNQKPLLDDYLKKDDFENFKVFACKFNTDNFIQNAKSDDFKRNTVSGYIYSSINSRTKELLKNECPLTSEISEDFKNAVYGDLDRILKDKFLYNSTRFECKPDDPNKPIGINVNGVCVGGERKEETQRLIEITKQVSVLKIEEPDLIRMNRRLLEEAYKDEIFESKIPIPSNEKSIGKEIPSRIAFDENILFIKSPIFGSSIDINDLGLVGSISLFIILCLLRFSQSREIKNLNVSFKAAFQHDKLCHFYHALVMHQVLTSPQIEGENRNKVLAMLAKWIYFLPVIVIGLGVGYDYYSVLQYHLFEWKFVQNQLYFQLVPCFLLVLYMSLRCLERQFHIDRVWDHFYYILRDNSKTLKLKYEIQLAKDNNVDRKLVEICEQYFSLEPQKPPFWMVTLWKIGVFNLKSFVNWIVSSFFAAFLLVKNRISSKPSKPKETKITETGKTKE